VKALRSGRCQLPQKPAHNVSTFSASRHKATFTTHRACFVPATLLSFYLQGLDPHSNPDPSPGLLLPCRFRSRASPFTCDFEGLLLLRSGFPIRAVSSRMKNSSPPGFSPLRFSLSLPWDSGFPNPSSYKLHQESKPRPRKLCGLLGVSTAKNRFHKSVETDSAPTPMKFFTLSFTSL
jgi:hypothetical protein